MSIDRQQRRARKRDLLQIGEMRLKRGLPFRASLDELAGIALVLRQTLVDTKRPDRASRAAELMHSVFEASVKAQPSQLDVACRKGCGYCCHTWVSATAPEIFLLARAIIKPTNTEPALGKDVIFARTGATAGLSIAERFGKKLPCAVLSNNACGFYAARPIVCRQVVATDLAGCLDEFEGTDFDGEVVASRLLMDHASNCRLPLQAALETLGLPAHSYELSAGLQAALSSGAESEWLRGSDVFATADRGPAVPAGARQLLAALVAEIEGL
jgi:Fe-S-cluster containining protein